MALSGIAIANLDRGTAPSENFYRFANGGWLDSNPIPADYSRWGSFEELNELCNAQLHAILNDCAADSASPDAHAVAAVYLSGMDEERCKKEGFAPISDVYKAIAAVEDARGLVKLKAAMTADMGVDGGMWRLSSIPDAKESSWEVVSLSQSGSLGMGDRDFYFADDKKELREKYVKHVANMLVMAGCEADAETAASAAEEFMKLETAIAEKCMTKTERRDPHKTYNKFESVEDFAKRSGSGDVIPWPELFELSGLKGDFGGIVCDNPPFFEHMGSLLTTVSLDTWKTYLRFHATTSMADFLGPDAEAEKFDFFGKAMTGQQEMKARWKRVLNDTIMDLLDHSISIMYTERHFSAETKKMCLDMVNVLTSVLRDRIPTLEWMQDDTKEKALRKLDAFRPMIGFPDKWETDDIPELLEKLSPDSPYASNVRACEVRQFKRIIQRINKPVDPDRWEMPACMVNAYFHPLKNVIVFPAAILQPPFLYHPTKDSPHGDPAINFAAIGGVICHEITHSFDDQGRKFDEKGELADWWTAEDAAEYERRAANMISLCDNFTTFGKNLNGKLCLGENIADYGGVKIAYQGMQRFIAEHGPLPSIDGFTPEQRFFLGWASIWRGNIREENALKRIILDPHAPGEFRGNIVQLLEEFHSAFDVKEGDTMYVAPEKRCEIW